MENHQFSIPFGGILSDKYFYQKGRLFLTNAKRSSSRKTRETQTCLDVDSHDGSSVTVSKYPSTNPDSSISFERAFKHLDNMAKTSSKNKTKSVLGCKAVLEYMEKNSSVMAMKNLIAIY